MGLSLKAIRLKSAWLAAPAYLLLARPTFTLLLVGGIVAAAGIAVRAWAAGTIHKNRVLTTGGPYAHTRNPLYVGSFMVGLGLSVASGRVLILVGFLLFFMLVYRAAILREEERLEELFGEDFQAYRRHVPRFFPRLLPYRADRARAPARRAAAPEPGPYAPALATGDAAAGSRFRLRRYVGNGEYNTLLAVGLLLLTLTAMVIW